MIILEEQGGLNAGLNRGLKIGKFIKRNIKSAKKDISIKNAIKVGKVVVPLATTAMSFIPGGGVATKLLNSKVGRAFTKVKNGKAFKAIDKVVKSKAGQFAVKNVINPTIKNAIAGQNTKVSFEDAPQNEVMQNATPTPAQLQTLSQLSTASETGSDSLPNQAQLETLSDVKDIPLENLKEEVATQKEALKNESQDPTKKTDYTIPIVVGVGALGAVLLATSSNNN